MIKRLDHIAIAVPDLQQAIQRFCSDLGLPFDGQEPVPAQQTITAFIPAGETRIELVTPLDDAGPIKTSLEKRGPGVHHLCFETDDIDADVARLRGLGYRFTSDAPRPGAHGCRVIFVHPKSAGGVLIELAEYPTEPGAHP